MSLTVQIEPPRGATPSVSYRWDTDTDILSAQVDGSPPAGPVATVEVQGLDGSGMILDVRGGRIRGVEEAARPCWVGTWWSRRPPRVSLRFSPERARPRPHCRRPSRCRGGGLA